jgi:hypothetical protein
MKVGDLVRSPIWGVAHNRGIIAETRDGKFKTTHLVLWMDGGNSWNFEDDLEIISESR